MQHTMVKKHAATIAIIRDVVNHEDGASCELKLVFTDDSDCGVSVWGEVLFSISAGVVDWFDSFPAGPVIPEDDIVHSGEVYFPPVMAVILGIPLRDGIAEDIAPGISEVALLGNPLRDAIAEDIAPGISEVALGTPKGGAREDIEGGNNELTKFGGFEVDNPL